MEPLDEIEVTQALGSGLRAFQAIAELLDECDKEELSATAHRAKPLRPTLSVHEIRHIIEKHLRTATTVDAASIWH